MKKYIKIFVSIFIVIACIDANDLKESTKKKALKDYAFAFPTIEVSMQTMSDSKRYYGKTIQDESRVYSISVRADGFIEELFVDKNYMQVKAKEPLFAFYAPEIVDAQSELLATLGHDQAQQKLLLLGVDSKEIAKIKKMRKVINAVTFYAPFDGIVFDKNVSVGSGVKKGNEIFKLIDLKSLWVVANINQEDLNFIKENGNSAYAKIEGHQERVLIKLDKIYPNVIDNYVQVRFVLDNPNLEFFPNAFAYIDIESKPREMLVLPKNAVLFKNNKYFAFMYDGGELIPQQIQARRIKGARFYEVLEGLEKGDKVIKDALFVVDSDAQNNGLFDE